MNSKEDILNNGQLEGLKSYTIFKRKTPGFKRYNCENLKVIDKWYLKICKNTSPKINCKYWFGVVGFLRDGTLLQSSPILEIESPKILITENSRYKLEGNNDLRKNVPHSEFSREELNKFLNGFPKDWMNIFRIELEKIYGKNLYNPEKEIKVEMNREMDKLYENLIEEKKKESRGDKVKVRDKVKVDKRDSSLLKGDSSMTKRDSLKGDISLLKGDSFIKGDSSLLKGDSSLLKGDSSLVKDSMIKSNNSNFDNPNLNKPLRVDSIKKDEIKKQDNNNKDLIQDFFNDNKTTWIPKKPNKNYNQNWNKNHNKNQNYKRTIYDNKNLKELQRDSLQRDSLENVLDELLVAQKEIDGFLLKDDQKKKPKEIEWLPKGKNEERNEEGWNEGENEGILSKSMEDKSKGFIKDLSKSMEEKESDYKKINRESKDKDNNLNPTPTSLNTLIAPNNSLNKLDYDVEGIFEDIFKETSSKKNQ